jgi:hypothetical protein
MRPRSFSRWRHLILLICIGLGACATQAQRQLQTIVQGNKAADAEYVACVTAIYSSPASEPVRPHFPLKATDATLAQLADGSLVTADQAETIFSLHPQVQDCQRRFLTELMNTTPAYVPILTDDYNKFEDDLLLLVQRKMTWGEFTKRRRDRAAAVQAAIQAISQRIMAGLEREHENEMARRQAAAQAFAQWAQTQQMINAVNRPVMTNCNAIGNMVNCFSH